MRATFKMVPQHLIWEGRWWFERERNSQVSFCVCEGEGSVKDSGVEIGLD